MKVEPDIRVVVPNDNATTAGTKVYIFGRELERVIGVSVQTEFLDADKPIETIVGLRLWGRRVIIENEDASPSQEDDKSSRIVWSNLPG